jgi:hypothetical protein
MPLKTIHRYGLDLEKDYLKEMNDGFWQTK